MVIEFNNWYKDLTQTNRFLKPIDKLESGQFLCLSVRNPGTSQLSVGYGRRDSEFINPDKITSNEQIQLLEESLFKKDLLIKGFSYKNDKTGEIITIEDWPDEAWYVKIAEFDDVIYCHAPDFKVLNEVNVFSLMTL